MDANNLTDAQKALIMYKTKKALPENGDVLTVLMVDLVKIANTQLTSGRMKASAATYDMMNDLMNICDTFDRVKLEYLRKIENKKKQVNK